MRCTNCGASLLETDRFCSKCGEKVVRRKKCPDCGALLRDGEKFCHKCGRLVEDITEGGLEDSETADLPIETLEQNILSETAAGMKNERRSEAEHAAKRRQASSEPERRRTSSAPSKKTAPPPAPAKKKRPVYEEEDWEEDDWDEEDYETGPDMLTVMTVIVGCVVLLVVAVLAFSLYRQYMPKNYDGESDKRQEQEAPDEEDGGEQGEEQKKEQDAMAGEQSVETVPAAENTGSIKVISNVNVRDKPSTQGTNVIKVAKKGEVYEYTDIVDGTWYQVVLEDGGTGYMFKDYVEPTE